MPIIVKNIKIQLLFQMHKVTQKIICFKICAMVTNQTMVITVQEFANMYTLLYYVSHSYVPVKIYGKK